MVLEGRFRFLSREERLGQPIDWAAEHMPLLWRFNLHYFDYLHLLTRAEQATLCHSWVEANPVGRGIGWHPYPTSLRIVNWCKAGLAASALQESLYQQAAYLYRNLETYVQGNHLLENARALVMAGCFFEGQGEAPQWLEKGVHIYREETRAQILDDGGHFERSPMYHGLVLEGYLDVLNVLPPEHADRSWLAETARRMGDVLVSVTHPDGQLALFNDATQEIAPTTERLRGYLRALTGYEPLVRTSLPAMGYFIHRDGKAFLIIDGGAVGPDHVPAHAHADVFSYELSIGGRPFVVDSGVYEYKAGAMRDYVRSTDAHNTVCVDGLSQVECWGSFRVARRFTPCEVTFSKNESLTVFEGRFSGYAYLIGDGIQHHRRVEVDEATHTITVQDKVWGKGRHRVESRIHLHPGVTVTRTDTHIVLQHAHVVCWLMVDLDRVRLEEGWYCPRFGVKQESKVLIIGGAVSLPEALSYSIQY